MKDTILLYRGESFNSNFFYFSGLDIDNSFLLMQGGKKRLLVSKLEERGARKTFKGKIVVLDDFYPYLKKELKSRKVKIDGARLPARIYEKLSGFCKPVDASMEFYTKRMVKNKDEIEKIKKAVKITTEILDGLEITKDMTENEIKQQLLLKTLEKGMEPAFEPIVASGMNTAVPHHKCTNKKIEDFVMVDFGVKFNNYHADMTRCYAVSYSENAERETKLYQKLHAVFDSIIEEMPSMKTGKDLAEFTEKAIAKSGLPKMIHAAGHGVGLDIHEFPRLGKKYEDKLAGTVFALEPAAYYKTYGARFEEVVYYDGKKVKVL